MVVGTPPGTGPQLVDGLWLQGLAGGVNQAFIAGVNLAVNSQTGGYFLPGLLQLVEVDTAVASGSLTLPAAIAGTEIAIFNNNTGNTINIFANPNPNAQNGGALDKINNASNATATTIANQSNLIFFCMKNGSWLTK